MVSHEYCTLYPCECMHVSRDTGVIHCISLLIQFYTRYCLQTPHNVQIKVNVLLQIEV